ncbi:TetR/AcrR family transcriptional regulator, partial [Streptomyces carpinensis]
ALQAGGLVSPALDVERASAALLAGIQGGVSIMMSTGDSTHLRAALDDCIERLRASAGDRDRT